MPHGSSSNALQLVEGASLGGQYRLSHCLGSGGMGTVWQAFDRRLKRQVAIKFLETHQTDTAAAEQRFQREALLAGKIQNPHVVQIFEQGSTADGRPYIVMELLEGEDLRSRIAREGPLAPQLALSILAQVNVALSHAHHLGLVHRDIKPSNIFLVPSYNDGIFVKLLDFGVAKDLYTPITKLTFTGAFIGTPFYISPEQLSDPQRVGPSADIWATAVTTYEMLTGTVPFGAGAALPELLFKISKGAHVLATTANPSLPRAIDGVFEKAFRASPATRFASVEELCAALSRVLFHDDDRDLSPTLSASEMPDSVERLQVSAHKPSTSRFARYAIPASFIGVALLVSGAWWRHTQTLMVRPAAIVKSSVPDSRQVQPPDAERDILDLPEGVVAPPLEAAAAPASAADSSRTAKAKLLARRERPTPSNHRATPPPRRVVNYGF